MANLSNMLASVKIPNIRLHEINVTAVEELLNQPNNNVNMIVYNEGRALRNCKILLCMAAMYCAMRLINYLINRTDWQANTRIPKISSRKNNVTVVEEFLNQPDNNISSIVFVEDRAFPSSRYSTLLCVAVEKRDEELIEYLINRKSNRVGSAYGNRNPLYIAAVNGDTKVFKKWYHLGANIHLKSKIRLSPLMLAARFGHFEIIKFLIEQGLDVNITERKCGSSLLHHAAASSNYKLVKFLLDNNAEIDAKKRNGETPILCAISNGRINIVKLLIARGADINNGQGTIKRSSLIYKTHKKKSNLKYLPSFDEPITDVHIFNNLRQTVLHYKLSSFDTCAKSCSVDFNVQNSNGQFACVCMMISNHFAKHAIITRLIITLTSAGLTVCEGNRQAVKKGYDGLIKTCLEELQKMKINKVGVSNITFFNVLHMSFHYLAIRLKFASLDQVINKGKLKIAYPLYEGLLFHKLSKVQQRIKYLEEVEEFFEGMLWDLGLPSTFIRELWSYFTNTQLQKLILHKKDNLSRF